MLSHNKTLAAQLFQEFRVFFPDNAVEYFVSYYDYYQPEAYVPQTDTYIEKETSINEEIDRLRLRATKSLFERRDVLIVASVSCIYGLGSPEAFYGMLQFFERGDRPGHGPGARGAWSRCSTSAPSSTSSTAASACAATCSRSCPPTRTRGIRVEFFGDEIERITRFDPLRGDALEEIDRVAVYPQDPLRDAARALERAIDDHPRELRERLAELRARQGKLLEAPAPRAAHPLRPRDAAARSATATASRTTRATSPAAPPGEPPPTLLDYFPEDFLLVVDESHQTMPQVRGMYHGDRSRKQTLVDYGFRLPSALDNRPLTFEEFDARVGQRIYVSATPAPWELERTGGVVVEQVIRPTGLLDPVIELRPAQRPGRRSAGARSAAGGGARRARAGHHAHQAHGGGADPVPRRAAASRCATCTATSRRSSGSQIITALRRGEFDVLVGINLLREGLDLPEVSLVAILDADKEGFLRSETSLIQTAGRAARNLNGRVDLLRRPR